MAYRHHVLRCTAFGKCYAGAEEWSTGFYMGVADADVDDPTQAAADAFNTKWQTFFTAVNSGITSNYVSDGVRISKLDKTTGKSIVGQNYYSYYTTPIAGTGGGQFIPPQQTLVASLQARPDAGLGAKGRMFLPGVAHALSTGAKITSGDAIKVRDTLATFFNTLNDDPDVPGRLINASKGRLEGLFGNQPVNRYVQDLLIGNVYDTQRRRRNQLIETYVSTEIFLD